MSEPLHKTIQVGCSPEHAFKVFTSRVDLWWPPGHRRFNSSTMVLEARLGGRFLERSAEGEEAMLGEVLVCEPPSRITYTWFPGASKETPTEVEVSFLKEGTGTRVNVLHHPRSSGERWGKSLTIFKASWDRVLASLGDYIANQPLPNGDP